MALLSDTTMPKKQPKYNSEYVTQFLRELISFISGTYFEPNDIIGILSGRYFPFLTREDKEYLQLRLVVRTKNYSIYSNSAFEELISEVAQIVSEYDEFDQCDLSDLSTLTHTLLKL